MMKRISFGRSSDRDIVISNNTVSRHHGYLCVDEDKVYIEDDNSTHGIQVNGMRINGRKQLNDGDLVVLASNVPFNWKSYIRKYDNHSGHGHTSGESGASNVPRSKPIEKPLVSIPSQIEINQNYANVYRNASDGADWKVPLKRNMGDKIGNAVGSTLGCIISAIIIVAVIAIVVAIAS